MFQSLLVKEDNRAPDKGGTVDNSKIIFLLFKLNICYDPSLEPSKPDGSNDGSQRVLK